MMLDSLLNLASSLALPTGSTYTQANPYMSATYWNTVAIQDWGMGNTREDIEIFIRIATTVTGNANSTLQFSLVGGSTSTKVTTGGTPDATIALAPATAIAQANFSTQATAGTVFSFKWPRGFAYQYINIGVIVGTATLTAGAIDCWIGNSGTVSDNKAYAAGYTV